MRLPALCLALLCAAAGTGSPGAAREQPPPRWAAWTPVRLGCCWPGARGGRAAARPGAEQAGSGMGRGLVRHRLRCRAVCRALPLPPPGATTALEELLRELQLLLKGMVKEQAKTRREVWEGYEEEEEHGEDNPQARSRHRVEAAFRCRTRENISIKQRAQQELQLYYIPEGEGMFHHSSGLNLISGQYTAPDTGYYTFTTTLHIVHREQWRKGQPCRGNRLRVLICVQSRCQYNSNLETVSRLESGGDFFTVSVTGVLYLQAGQYASVFVDNTVDSPLTVQSGSDFSAILLGV